MKRVSTEIHLNILRHHWRHTPHYIVKVREDLVQELLRVCYRVAIHKGISISEIHLKVAMLRLLIRGSSRCMLAVVLVCILAVLMVMLLLLILWLILC